MSTPSFTYIPAGRKVGTVYTQIPNDSDNDFDFSRSTIGTYRDKDGLLQTAAIDEPRHQWDDGDTCPHLLLEPQSTNTFQRSEEFTNSYWFKDGTTVVDNIITSPDGTANASIISEDGGILSHSIIKFGGWANGVELTCSVFVKAINRDLFYIANGSTGDSVFFNLTTGTIEGTIGGGMTGTIESCANGWYRVTGTHTSAANQTLTMGISGLFDGVFINSTRFNGLAQESVAVWGAQLEALPFPTSYIPTVTSTVTRTGDICNGADVPTTFDSTQGVFLIDTASLGFHSVIPEISISDGTNANRIELRYQSAVEGNQVVIRKSSSVIYTAGLAFDTTQRNKLAVRFKDNDISTWFNGTQQGTTDTGDTLFSVDTLTSIQFDGGAGTERFFGKVYGLRIYNDFLTDQEMIDLTTI